MHHPFKLAVAQSFTDFNEHDASYVQNSLPGGVYSPKLLTPKNIEFMLQSLKAVGILQVSREQDGNIFYALTKDGNRRLLKALGNSAGK